MTCATPFHPEAVRTKVPSAVFLRWADIRRDQMNSRSAAGDTRSDTDIRQMRDEWTDLPRILLPQRFITIARMPMARNTRVMAG
jgi:hypothetical protein